VNEKLENKLVELFEGLFEPGDPSHDLQHTLRVLEKSKYISKMEGADLDITVPASIFHDLVVYPKNDPKDKMSAAHSAKKAGELLGELEEFPANKIDAVKHAVECCSFNHGKDPETLEAKVVRDADLLEATGVIAVMRTFSYSGKISRPFYDPKDPFAENRDLDDIKYSLDLFYTRLLKIGDHVVTPTAKKMVARREDFLKHFIEELKLELQGR
jgi:uncharacterized protein